MPTERAVENGKAKFLGIFATLFTISVFVNVIVAPSPSSVIQLALQVALVAYVWYRGSRGGIVLVASLLIALGVILAIIGATREETGASKRAFVTLVGILWSGTGLFLLTSRDIRAYFEHRAGRPLIAEDDERLGGSRGVQIVGSSCGVCAKRFASEFDAVLCDVCKTPFHGRTCLASHVESSQHRMNS